MARLDEVRDALIEAPAQFGIQFCYPQQRIGAPPGPVTVKEASIEGATVRLKYSRYKLRGELVPSDVIWHQESNVVALVIERIAGDEVRVMGLAAPETPEEKKAFLSSEGKGTWLAVFQAWKDGWSLPSELSRVSEMVDASNPEAWDAGQFKETRARGRMGGWAQQGLIDPSKMLSAKTSAFLARQKEAMMGLYEIPDEKETPWPDGSDLEPGEVKVTNIPIEGEAMEVKRTARNVRRGVISSGALGPRKEEKKDDKGQETVRDG